MRRMFVAMALFCFAAWLLSIAFRPFGIIDSGGIDRLVEFVGALACAIAAVGTVTKETPARIVRSLMFLVLGITAVFLLVMFWRSLR